MLANAHSCTRIVGRAHRMTQFFMAIRQVRSGRLHPHSFAATGSEAIHLVRSSAGVISAHCHIVLAAANTKRCTKYTLKWKASC